MRQRKGMSGPAGATLIEILVALAMAALIMFVVALAHHALTREAAGVFGKARENTQVLALLREVKGDLQQLVLPEPQTDCTIELDNTADALVRLSFCRREPALHRGAMHTGRLQRVTYTIGMQPSPSVLVRTVAALNGPEAYQPTVTNRLSDAWPHFRILLHDGAMWHTNWPAGDTDDETAGAIPAAAMIQLLDPDTAEVREDVVVIIPGALSVTSSLTRAAGQAK